LLDEPFGALDAKVRKDLRRWLRRLHDELHVTSVFVTHDQEEALEVADRVVVLNAGRVEQVGTPDEVYDHPASPFVYEFLGDVNLFHGRVHDGHAAIGDARVQLPDTAGSQDAAVFYARPHEIEILRGNPGGSAMAATVHDIRPLGATVRVELDRADGHGSVEVELARDRFNRIGLRVGEAVYLEPRRLRIFGEEASRKDSAA
jgi:sulfate transport system ATP-binding protein